MKFAIFFALAIFAVVAQANARSVADEAIERGAIADALKKKLVEAKEKVDKLLENAENTLKQKLAEAQKQAEQLIAELKEKANEVTEELFERVQQLIEKIEKLEDRLKPSKPQQ